MGVRISKNSSGSGKLGIRYPVIEEIGTRIRVMIFLAESHRIQVTRLIHCLKDSDLSVKEMMSGLGLNHRLTFMYDYLKPAMEGGFVEMTDPDSPKSPKQKYRLTRRGKEIFS